MAEGREEKRGQEMSDFEIKRAKKHTQLLNTTQAILDFVCG